MKIEELDFSVRTYHVLKRAGINTGEQVQRMTDDDLYRLRNIGKLTVSEIREKLPYIPPEKIELPTMTIADKIRAMADEELAVWIQSLMDDGDTGFHCQQKKECQDLLEQDKLVPEEWCKQCMVAWLRKPIEKPPIPFGIHDDRQESGLLEDD